MKNIIFFISILAVSSTTIAQNIGVWSNYADMKMVTDIKSTEEGFWTSTTGGAAYYSNTNKNFEFFLTNSEGLSSQNLTALDIDSEGRIWFGMQNGIIDIYDPTDGTIISIKDIFESNNSNKRINEILIISDTAYVSTNFGLSLINTKHFGFISTTLKFGDFPTSQIVNSVTVDDKIYVSTVNGIAIQRDGASNLLAPESWITYSTGSDISANKIYKTVLLNNELIAGTDKGLFKFENNLWSHYAYTNEIKDLGVSGNNLLILFETNLLLRSGNDEQTLLTSADRFFTGFDISNNDIILVSNFSEIKIGRNEYLEVGEGVIKLSNNSSETLLPNGPINNSFESITVDKNGVLWAATGKDKFGRGFMKFDEGIWTNYNKDSFPELPNNNYHNVSSDDNQVYLSNWGSGLTIEQDGKFSYLTAYNSELVGIPDDPNYVVIRNAERDSNGDLWFFNHASADGMPIIQLTKDSTWYHYRFPYFQLTTKVFITDGTIDENNTKWFTITGLGLFYFNEQSSPEDESNDVWGWLRVREGLNSDEVGAIAVDNRGELWIGTDKGMNILANTASPQSLITNVFPLRQQSITAIAVDPLNNKWVGTHQGVFVMTSDGSQLIAQYDSKNSPLPSDDIKSIAIDKKSGLVYIGTSFGVSTLTTFAVEPKQEFDEILVYPNPFKLDKHSKITIDGLVKNSSIKILSVSGKLVKTIISPGGRIAFWDGKDENGKFVASGIYVLVAFDEEADKIITSKFAVIR
ncbi:MAG: hypothetical protein L3J41_17440 [Melioribacteraceae bacterium]|nr:hypothetical protein [Melioribacteraceae bacterium]